MNDFKCYSGLEIHNPNRFVKLSLFIDDSKPSLQYLRRNRIIAKAKRPIFIYRNIIFYSILLGTCAADVYLWFLIFKLFPSDLNGWLTAYCTVTTSIALYYFLDDIIVRDIDDINFIHKGKKY